MADAGGTCNSLKAFRVFVCHRRALLRNPSPRVRIIDAARVASRRSFLDAPPPHLVCSTAQVLRAATALLKHLRVNDSGRESLGEHAESVHLVFKLKTLPGRGSNKPVRMYVNSIVAACL